uniref:Uncharacterized protein n=1 Tax=viral metagenome TaxID=1070528 RepID=A0A6M3JP71_9ZZZZ
MKQVITVEKPKIVDGEMLSFAKDFLKNDDFLKLIRCNEEFFIKNHTVSLASNDTEHGWFCIVDARLRLSHYSCDRVNIKNLILIDAKFSIFFQELYLSVIQILYTPGNISKFIVGNEIMLLREINFNICERCSRHIKICTCNDDEVLVERSGLGINVSGSMLHHPENPFHQLFMEDDTNLFIQEDLESKIDWNRYNPIIEGIITTLKVRDKVAFRNKARQIIKTNPNIQDNDLAKILISSNGRIQ